MSFKIFPATLTHDGRKVPLITGWKDKATDDPAQIQAWQQEFGDRIKIWGIPTGGANGIFALDIDVKKVNGLESLQKLGYQVPATMYQRTPSGGYHFIFKTKDGVHYNNTVDGKLGLDTRGDGGWIAYYGLNDSPIADIPDWLFELTGKQYKEEVKPETSNITIAPDIIVEKFNTALNAIRQAPQGESNNTLNVQSYMVGQLVASGGLSRQYAEEELLKAAKERGKPDYEARATIKSGLDGGMKNPLTAPFGSTPPTAAFELPPVPQPPDIVRWTPKYFNKGDLLNFSRLKRPQLFKDWSTCDISLTTADGGTGKTTLKLYEAVCLALGDRFLGFDCAERGKTLFITGEDTAEKLAAMLGAMLSQMGLLNDEAKLQIVLDSIVVKKDSDLCLIKKNREGFLVVNEDALNKVMEAVDDIKPKLIVFDPIASFWGSESALNDMNKAVSKFVSQLVERSGACVEMINHMGKQSSANKDTTQFAGRGGTGLPSHSRVSKVLHSLNEKEYREATGEDLVEGKTAMMCTVNKFSDGSPLLGKPFIIEREGFLFTRKSLTPAKEKEINIKNEDISKVYNFISETRKAGKYLSTKQIIAVLNTGVDKISENRIKHALTMLTMSDYQETIVKEVPNPDELIGGKVYTIQNLKGEEL